MDQLDAIMQTFYYQICDVAKWLFAIRIASDIIKNANNGDVVSSIKTLINGGAAYGALYSVVSVLDSVQAAFQSNQ